MWSSSALALWPSQRLWEVLRAHQKGAGCFVSEGLPGAEMSQDVGSDHSQPIDGQPLADLPGSGSVLTFGENPAAASGAGKGNGSPSSSPQLSKEAPQPEQSARQPWETSEATHGLPGKSHLPAGAAALLLESVPPACVQ